MPNQIQAIAMLPTLSVQQLSQLLQANDGSVPTYAVMAELQSRKKQMAAYAGTGKPPTTSVKQDMMQSGLQSLAPQMGGAGAPPPQMMAQAPTAPQGMAEGGQVYKYPYPLKDSETRLVPYDALTRGKKQEMDLANRREAAGLESLADKQRRDYIAAKLLGGLGEAFYGDMGRPITDSSPGIRAQAEQLRNWKPSPNTLYGDDIPHSLKQGMAEGGMPGWWDTRATPPTQTGDINWLKKWFSKPGQPVPTASAVYGPDSGWAQGTAAAPDIAIPPPYTDTPDINIAQPKTGSGGIRAVASAAPSAYTPKEIQYGDIAAERAKIPQGTAIPEGLADYKKMLAEMGADRQQNKWLAFAAGAARMGQTPGGLGKAASAGMEEGLQYLAKNNAVNREQQVAAMRERGAMGIAQDRQVLMNEEIARRALEDQARLGLGNAGLQQRAAEAAAHNATQLDVARIGLQGHMAQVGSYKQAQIDAGRERMMQTEFAKAVEETRKQLAPNMKYMDPVNGAALLQRDAEQAALQRMRMIKDSEKYFNFPQERAAPGFVTPPANGPMRAPIG